MTDSLELHLNIQKSLEKELKESDKQLNNINKNSEELAKNQENINDKTIKWHKALNKIKEAGTELIAMFTAGFGLLNLGGIISDTFELDKNLSRLAARTSLAGENFGTLQAATFGVARATGIAATDAANLIEALKGFKVADRDLLQLGKSTVNFYKATGMAQSTVAQLVGSLTRFGKLSVTQTEGLLRQMAVSQRLYNLTENELTTMGDTLLLNTKRMQQFGKTAVEIQRMQKGIIGVSGALSQVGIEAGRASQLINDLLDPSRIEENGLMYAKLGVSISDVITGSVDMASLAPKFKQLGQEIKDGGMAGVMLAKQLGLSVEEGKQLADIDMTKFSAAMQESGGDASKALALMNRQGKGAGEVIAETWENVKTSLIGVVTKLMPIIKVLADKFSEFINTVLPTIEKVLNTIKLDKVIAGIAGFIKSIPLKLMLAIGAALIILPKLFGGVFAKKAMYTAITDGVRDAFSIGATEGLQMGTQKAGISRSLAVNRSGADEDKARRVQQSIGYKRRQGAADVLDATAQTNMFGFMKNMVKSTAEWNRELSMSSRPLSKLLSYTEKMNKNTEDMGLNSIESARLQSQLTKEQVSLLSERNKILQGYIDGGNLSAQTEKKINNQIKANNAEQNKLNDDLISSNASIENRTIKYYDNLSKQQRGVAKEELEAKRDILKSTQDQILSQQISTALAIELLDIEQDALGAEQKKLLGKRDIGQLSLEELDKYKILQSRMTEVNSLLKESDESYSNGTLALTKSADEAAKIANELSKIQGDIAPNIPKELKAWPDRIRDSMGAFSRNIKAGVQNFGDKVTDSARGFKLIMKNVLDPKNIAAAAKGMVGGLGNALMGGMGIMGLISMIGNLKPVQDTIANLMKQIAPLLEQVGAAFAPLISAITPLLTTLVKTLLPPMLHLMGYVLKALVFLPKVIMEAFGKTKGPLYDTLTALEKTADGLIKFQIDEQALIADANTGLVDAANDMAESLDPDSPETFNVRNGALERINPTGNGNANNIMRVEIVGETADAIINTADNTGASAGADLQAAQNAARAGRTGNQNVGQFVQPNIYGETR